MGFWAEAVANSGKEWDAALAAGVCRDNLEAVANAHIRSLDGTAGKLNDAFQLHAHRGDTERGQAAPQLDDLELTI